MLNKYLLAATSALLLLAAPNANAALLNFSGSFSGSGGTATTPAISSLSGSFDFFFDTSVVTGVGTEVFNIPLNSLSLNPNPLGVTSFNTGNSGAELRYQNGVLNGGIYPAVTLFGAVSGPTLSSDTDDWWALYDDSLNLFSVAGSVASEPGQPVFFDAYSQATLQGSLSVREVVPGVPEPSSALAGVLAFAGLLGAPAFKTLRRRA